MKILSMCVDSSQLIRLGQNRKYVGFMFFQLCGFLFFLSGENAMGRGLKHVECMITLSSVEYLSPMLMTDL